VPQFFDVPNLTPNSADFSNVTSTQNLPLNVQRAFRLMFEASSHGATSALAGLEVQQAFSLDPYQDLRAATGPGRESGSRLRLYLLSAAWMAASASGAMIA
jgi:hypothetical protein